MESSVPNTRSVLSTRNITLMDEDMYYCGGFYGSQQMMPLSFGEIVTVNVRGIKPSLTPIVYYDSPFMVKYPLHRTDRNQPVSLYSFILQVI